MLQGFPFIVDLFVLAIEGPDVTGTKPINVHPYRYPHYQKTEMEKLIRDMLDQRIIKPSQSPFSSPVLLVRKNTCKTTFRIHDGHSLCLSA